jgi:hypothetical protein
MILVCMYVFQSQVNSLKVTSYQWSKELEQTLSKQIIFWKFIFFLYFGIEAFIIYHHVHVIRQCKCVYEIF